MNKDKREKFWELPLAELSPVEWEALCDRCGKCCLIKLEDEDTGEIVYTRLACKLFDGAKCACADYANRFDVVDDCLNLDRKAIPEAESWLPKTCAYVLRYHNKPLPDWHYLKAGDFAKMYEGNHSVKGKTESEDKMDDLEDAIPYIDRNLGP